MLTTFVFNKLSSPGINLSKQEGLSVVAFQTAPIAFVQIQFVPAYCKMMINWAALAPDSFAAKLKVVEPGVVMPKL